MPEHIFHGGCHDCPNDISICPTCQYMVPDWSLPDLNPAHQKREDERSKMQQRAWDAYNAKNKPEKKKVSHLKVLKKSDVERNDSTTNKKRKLSGLLSWVNPSG